MYDSIPKQVKPGLDHKSDAELRFPDINSVIFISSARAAVAGRGEPIHNLILSEAAHYQPGTYQRIVLPALQRVPRNGTIILESTPYGEDEVFYPEVQASLNETGTFTLHTVYWWDNPDNTLAEDYPHLLQSEREMDLTVEEQKLQGEHGLTLDQLRWRRYRKRETARQPELFEQEHLEDIGRCFLTTGLPYYDPFLLDRLARDCYPAPHSSPGGGDVWFPPEKGAYYVMGIDPGQGKVTESVAAVWKLSPDRGALHCASLSGFIDPLDFASPVLELARWYNNAFLVPEANSHGLGLIAQLRDYPNIYFREDIINGQHSMRPGWLTTPLI